MKVTARIPRGIVARWSWMLIHFRLAPRHTKFGQQWRALPLIRPSLENLLVGCSAGLPCAAIAHASSCRLDSTRTGDCHRGRAGSSMTGLTEGAMRGALRPRGEGMLRSGTAAGPGSRDKEDPADSAAVGEPPGLRLGGEKLSCCCRNSRIVRLSVSPAKT